MRDKAMFDSRSRTIRERVCAALSAAALAAIAGCASKAPPAGGGSAADSHQDVVAENEVWRTLKDAKMTDVDWPPTRAIVGHPFRVRMIAPSARPKYESAISTIIQQIPEDERARKRFVQIGIVTHYQTRNVSETAGVGPSMVVSLPNDEFLLVFPTTAVSLSVPDECLILHIRGHRLCKYTFLEIPSSSAFVGQGEVTDGRLILQYCLPGGSTVPGIYDIKDL